MGWSLSWAAIKGGNLQTACVALGLRATGKREEFAESKISGAALPTGWYLAAFNRSELKDRALAHLSRSGGVNHVCDVPAQLAKGLTGFRHDQDTPGLSGDVFEILERWSSGEAGLISRLFGKEGRK